MAPNAYVQDFDPDIAGARLMVGARRCLLSGSLLNCLYAASLFGQYDNFLLFLLYGYMKYPKYFGGGELSPLKKEVLL